jgi:hypothetical protein
MTLTSLFQKVTFLLGAGASNDAGCSLSQDMLKALRKDIEVELRTPEERKLQYYYKEIHDFVLASLSYQATLSNPDIEAWSIPYNIEDFVGIIHQIIDKEYIVPYPLVGNWNEKITKWENVDKDIFIKFKKFIERLLIKKYLLHNEIMNAKVLDPIRTLITKSEESFEIDIFTLNYDLTFEDHFNKPEETLVYNGFEGNEWVGNYKNHSQRINYYKMHGSMDWYFDRADESVKQNNDPNNEFEPLIIFGSANKMLSFDPFLFMLSKFRDKLQESNLYVVIGYSFHDKYINNLLIQQLAMVPERKMLVVDPRKKSVEDFVRMLDRVQKSKSIIDKIGFTRISDKKVDVESLKAEEFYQKYFSNSAKLLITKVEELAKEDRPFR